MLFNAKTELKSVLSAYEGVTIVAARFRFAAFAEDFIMMEGQDEVGLWEFLNHDYESGFGSQELFGTVWLSDGTWLSRGEYDGSEWWDHHKRPDLPTASRPWGRTDGP